MFPFILSFARFTIIGGLILSRFSANNNSRLPQFPLESLFFVGQSRQTRSQIIENMSDLILSGDDLKDVLLRVAVGVFLFFIAIFKLSYSRLSFSSSAVKDLSLPQILHAAWRESLSLSPLRR